jgi:hypothetical protein
LGTPVRQGCPDRSFEIPFDHALGYETQAEAFFLNSQDVIGGVRACLEKRSPHFEGS